MDDWQDCKDSSTKHLEQNDEEYEVDGCSIPYAVAEAIGAYTQDNPTGCNGPNTSFYEPCRSHDECYQTCDSDKINECDNGLNADMEDVCNGDIIFGCDMPGTGLESVSNWYNRCNSYKNSYHMGVLGGGQGAWEERQVGYCECCEDE